MAINLQFSRNFANIKYIKRRYNPIVYLSKFTSNKKILIKVVVTLNYDQFYN